LAPADAAARAGVALDKPRPRQASWREDDRSPRATLPPAGGLQRVAPDGAAGAPEILQRAFRSP